MGGVFTPIRKEGEWTPPKQPHQRPHEIIAHSLLKGTQGPVCHVCGNRVCVPFESGHECFHRYGQVVTCDNHTCRYKLEQIIALAQSTYLTNFETVQMVLGKAQAERVPTVQQKVSRESYIMHARRAGLALLWALAYDRPSGAYYFVVEGNRGWYFGNRGATGRLAWEYLIRKRHGLMVATVKRFVDQYLGCHFWIRPVAVRKTPPVLALEAMYSVRKQRGVYKVVQFKK